MRKITICLALMMSIAALRAQDATVNRPQEPRPPFPYRSEEVVFENPAAGITLAGTLTIPADDTADGTAAPCPAVVLITGSGAQNRDEEILGHKPFLVLADHLTRRGVAVLRFDDRGVGGSGGNPVTSTSADFATDAAAALDYLATRPETDNARTGLAGHSEGGVIAFMVAAAHPRKVAFVVSMAGPGVDGLEVSAMQVEDIYLAQGAGEAMARAAADKQRADLTWFYSLTPEQIETSPDEVAARMVPAYNMLPDEAKELARNQILASNTPWARFYMAHDPARDLARTECPVLAMGGSKDTQVRPSVNLPAIRAGLAAGGNTALTVIEYPGLNHLFQTATTGTVDEYARIEETFAPQALEDIAEWILKTVK